MLSLCALPLLCAPQIAAPDTIRVRSALAFRAARSGGRSAVFTDAVEARLVAGNFELPRPAKRVEAGKEGWIADPLLRGGYAFAVVESKHARVMILDASGHRHAYVNGVPRVGDAYALGITKLPVALRAGRNEFLFAVSRGRVRATLRAPKKSVFVEARDSTLPDVIAGETEALVAGVRVTNATETWQRGLRFATRDAQLRPRLFDLPPLSTRKLPLVVSPAQSTEPEPFALAVTLRDAKDTALDSIQITLRRRRPDQKHRRTFVSSIDGSVQYYAVTPPPMREGLARAPALFLTLHGASVEASRQARAYSPKDEGYVVAPTNRRPFGFDWEDWGRLDALEVLEEASRRFRTDARRTYLTGHSMGGHGTWILGAQFPDRFAAIAPSAGWRDFESYGRGSPPKPTTAVERMLDRAKNASRTLLLEQNLAMQGVYVLHGAEDRNVPVAQARFMRARLAAFHPNWAYYEKAGAGHWWGNACVDWPPLFDFLLQNELPVPEDLSRVSFTTVDPGISARCHWLEITAQLRSLEPSRVDARYDAKERALVVTTENVAELAVDRLPAEVTIDGKPAPAGARWALDAGGVWRAQAAPRFERKHPGRAGPFKAVFANRVLFVYGTGGRPEENAALLAKARYDAETFGYRGNGSIEIRADSGFDPRAEPDRNVVLYGNADTNAAWKALLGDAPIRVVRGEVRVGARRFEGEDLACLFVFPRPGSTSASVGAIAGTGLAGTRLTNQLRYFVSGAGFPDWLLYSAEMLEKGSAGLRGAGFFGPDWSLGRGADG